MFQRNLVNSHASSHKKHYNSLGQYKKSFQRDTICGFFLMRDSIFQGNVALNPYCPDFTR